MSGPEVLIVVDVQNGFVNERSSHVVEPIADFVRSWTSSGRRVLLTRFINDPGSQWERLIHWTRLQDAPEIELHPVLAEAIADVDEATVHDKRTYSSLTDDVLGVLKEIQPDRVFLTGIATDGCVLKTAVDLFELGFTPFVLSDLCASHAGDEIHKAGLLLIGRFIGTDQVGVSNDAL